MKPLHILLLGCLGLATAKQLTVVVTKVNIETITEKKLG